MNKLIASLAATAALIPTARAVGTIDYTYSAQRLNTAIQDGTDGDGNPIYAYEDHQSSLIPTGQSFAYNLSVPNVTVTSSLSSTLGLEQLNVDLSQNIQSSLGTALGSSVATLQFSVSQTTAFEAAGSFSYSGQVADNRCYLKEVGGSDIFNFSPSSDGSASPFNFTGVLSHGKTYLLEFGIGGEGDRTSSAGLAFSLTGAPIPEPETYAAFAGLALAGFAIIRRRTHPTVSGSRKR